MDTTNDLELITKTIPQLISIANRFEQRAAETISYADFLDVVNWVIDAAGAFAEQEFTELDPELVAGARYFENHSHHSGMEAMGKYLLLSMLADHPEVHHVATVRARDALWTALQTGELPADFDPGGRTEQPDADAAASTALRAERVLTDRSPHAPTDILIAPNCTGDILTHPPRIVRDAEGLQRVQLKGIDGWQSEGVVEAVTRLDARGLVLVATDDTTYLMTAADFDTPIE